MTELLEKAFAEASKLSQQEQDALAIWILDELASTMRWNKSLSSSSGALADLAREALNEHKHGRTLPLDPEGL